MAVQLAGGGSVGVALETVIGTYVAPVKFIPVLSESLKLVEDKKYRNPIHNIADTFGALQGYTSVDGDLTFELTGDTFVYMMYAMNGAVVKSGAGPYTYTFTPGSNATPVKTLSITVVRNGVVFGYTGCIVSKMTVTIQDGVLVGTFSMLGIDEATQSAPTVAWPTTDPAGPGYHDIKVGGASQSNIDAFNFSIDQGGSVFFPLRSGASGRKPKETRFGMRTVTVTFDQDFENRTDYDAFKAQTVRAIILQCTVTASNDIKFDFKKCVLKKYEPVLSNVGEIVRATGLEHAVLWDAASSKAFEIIVITAESIV